MFPRSLALAAVLVAAAVPADAQSLGAFSWQLQPYCNVVTVNITGTAGVYTLEGYDDQCGAPTRAPLTGVATPNPDGSIGFGFMLVTSPGGRGVQVEARVPLPGLSGPWTDSDGHKGTFAFNAKTGGSPRPLPPAAPPEIPPAFALRTDGGFLAKGSDGGVVPQGGAGARMMWHPGKAAFRAGAATGAEWDNANIGSYSAAFGLATTASGFSSLASGVEATASGHISTALGYQSVSKGTRSFAAGTAALAEGDYSIAIGGETGTGGIRGVAARAASAIALGVNHDLLGAGSVALGYGVSTSAAAVGSFVYGDRSTVNQIQSFLPNEFKVRAAGGTFFYSNPAMTTGVRLPANASAWTTLSDANSKENFRDLDGAEVLAKLAAMPIREWNYKAQEASVRHVGPTAQDFHAAFGLGEDPLRISTLDTDGIALRAIQALESRTQTLAAENRELRDRLAALELQLGQK